MKKTMNELKKYLEEYIKSGMWQWEAPCIGKDEVQLILNVFKALDKACEELNDFTEFVPMSNLPFEDETYTKFINNFDEEECINIWKYWLLNGCEEAINILSESVERATPKKPTIIPNDHNELIFECPNCHSTTHTNFQRKYCGVCGQALDWGGDS